VRLVLATRNPHKQREFSRLLHQHELEPLPERFQLPPETGATFAENALAKARAAAAHTGALAVADDSGIEAQALGGGPGVLSARYAGAGATDAENLAKLLYKAPAGSRLTYVCAVAFVDPVTGAEQLFQGTCFGRLADRPRGGGGFGYDPAFMPDEGEGGETMAEMSPERKDAISHRGSAIRQLAAWLEARAR
jgi:XTP/dITP diphosphohydrolase